jgi:hypothetical protein
VAVVVVEREGNARAPERRRRSINLRDGSGAVGGLVVELARSTGEEGMVAATAEARCWRRPRVSLEARSDPYQPWAYLLGREGALICGVRLAFEGGGGGGGEGGL